MTIPPAVICWSDTGRGGGGGVEELTRTAAAESGAATRLLCRHSVFCHTYRSICAVSPGQWGMFDQSPALQNSYSAADGGGSRGAIRSPLLPYRSSGRRQKNVLLGPGLTNTTRAPCACYRHSAGSTFQTSREIRTSQLVHIYEHPKS